MDPTSIFISIIFAGVLLLILIYLILRIAHITCRNCACILLYRIQVHPFLIIQRTIEVTADLESNLPVGSSPIFIQINEEGEQVTDQCKPTFATIYMLGSSEEPIAEAKPVQCYCDIQQ